MNGCATLEEGGRAGHKSRQLKKSCWPFKTSSHRHKRKRRYYIGERCLNIFSRSLLSPSLHPPSYFSIYILFSSLFSLFQRHSWRKRRGGVNLFAKSSRWNARGEREKIEKNDSMEEHATHSEWRAAFVFVRESPPPLNRSLPSFQWIYIHPMFKQPALLFDLREARNRAEWLNIDSPGSRETGGWSEKLSCVHLSRCRCFVVLEHNKEIRGFDRCYPPQSSRRAEFLSVRERDVQLETTAFVDFLKRRIDVRILLLYVIHFNCP